MTEDEYIEALTSIRDPVTRAVLLYHHAQLKSARDDTWIIRQSWNVIRYLQPFLAVALGIVLGKLV